MWGPYCSLFIATVSRILGLHNWRKVQGTGLGRYYLPERPGVLRLGPVAVLSGLALFHYRGTDHFCAPTAHPEVDEEPLAINTSAQLLGICEDRGLMVPCREKHIHFCGSMSRCSHAPLCNHFFLNGSLHYTNSTENTIDVSRI